ncbi:MAG: hypothetical protein AAF357_05790, partial [Verrucomicrobiota bacterium]
MKANLITRIRKLVSSRRSKPATLQYFQRRLFQGLSLLLLAFPAALPYMANAADVTWDGDTSFDWNTGSNWVGDIAPATSGDRAVFDAAGTGTITGDATVEQIRFSGSAGSFILGTLNTDTITFSNQNDASINIEMLTGSAAQTVAADLTVENDAASDVSIVNRDTTNALTISGDYIKPGNTGTARLEFGVLGTSTTTGVINMSGDVINNGTGILQLFTGGNTTLNLSGQVEQQGSNVMQTILLDSSTINVTGSGQLGPGIMSIRQGTLNFDNAGTVNSFDNNITLGSATQADGGNATLTMASGVVVDLNSSLIYNTSTTPGVANTATISGDG